MSEALIALLGVVIGGLLTWWTQRSTVKLQIQGAARARLEDILLDTVSLLLAAADPELHSKFDYGRVVTLIHRVQLVLDPRVSVDDRLNRATNDLGHAIQAAMAGDRDVHGILRAQSEVTEAAREWRETVKGCRRRSCL
jgi:hypothetical protein